ncbi:MAG: hypothetical protein R2849_03865 [Thermomicrobiales bacterium]
MATSPFTCSITPGGYSVVVRENPDGTQTLYWHDEPAGSLSPPYTDGAEARAMIYADGQYYTEYWDDGQWVDDPPDYDQPEEYDFEADGYLPDGTPEYFVDERWPEPEIDDRFQMTNHSETQDGGYARIYNADLDGNGVWDYQIHRDRESPTVRSGRVRRAPMVLEARFYVTQDAGGYYDAYDHDYYVDNPQGAAEYTEAQSSYLVTEETDGAETEEETQGGRSSGSGRRTGRRCSG